MGYAWVCMTMTLLHVCDLSEWQYCLAWYTVWLACTGFGDLYVNCGRNNTLIESFNNILLFGCCSSLCQVPNFTNTHKTTQCDSSTFHKDKECSHLCYNGAQQIEPPTEFSQGGHDRYRSGNSVI